MHFLVPIILEQLETELETADGFMRMTRTPFEFETLRSNPRFVGLRENIGLSGE